MADETITYNESQLAQYIGSSSRYTWRDALFSHPGYTDKKKAATFPIAHNSDLLALFTNILIPVESGFSTRYAINSCYRNPSVNGSPVGAGQHGKGQAADISCNQNIKMNKDMFEWIKNNNSIPYDQLIWEGSDPSTSDNPKWVHVSYNPSRATQRRQVLWTSDLKKYNPWTQQPNNASSGTPGPGTSSGTAPDQTAPKTEDEKKKMADAEDPEEAVKSANWEATLKRAAENQAYIEAGEVNAEWGQSAPGMPKDSDWISLKQYMLYLATRYTPQSVFPFIELIPCVTVDAAGAKYESDSGVPSEIEDKVTPNPKKFKDKLKAAKDKLAQVQALVQQKKDKVFEASQTESRDKVGIQASNNAAGISDLFNLDPFHEDFNFMGEPSEAGKLVKGLRNIGVRAYGQLVLSPGAVEGVPSKPGPIGFKDLEVQAGAQCENGIALITMSITDVQGNKFTDLNSPWSFIYDARPANVGGDFWFRYGWNIRLPDPAERGDRASQLFWTHPGWKTFGQPVRDFIMRSINPHNPIMILTQSINRMGMPSKDVNGQTMGMNYNMFDEGVIYNESEGVVTINRDPGYLLENYVKLSILNPELTVDDNGAITAKLNFRTTGAIAGSVPLVFASRTRLLAAAKSKLKLGDLILTVMFDSALSSYLSLQSDEERDKQIFAAGQRFGQLARTRQFEGLVYILGLEEGGNTGGINPDDIIINIDGDYKDAVINPDMKSEDTLIGWFRNVLEDNGMELNSAATGSGAGINAAWIITVTDDFEKEFYVPHTKPAGIVATNHDNALDIMLNEKDVFAYRFQGSLVTSLNIEKTEGDNALKIQADFDVSDMETSDSEDKQPLTLEGLKTKARSSASMDDRKRNLKILFSQLQTCKVTCICHPWIGPGKKVFVKGMGMFDGEYMVLEVTHSLGEDMMFKSEIKGGRILAKTDEFNTNVNAKTEAIANGDGNIASSATSAAEGGTEGAAGAATGPAGEKTKPEESGISDEEKKKQLDIYQAELDQIKADHESGSISDEEYRKRLSALSVKKSHYLEDNKFATKASPLSSTVSSSTSSAASGVVSSGNTVKAGPPPPGYGGSTGNGVRVIDKYSDY